MPRLRLPRPPAHPGPRWRSVRRELRALGREARSWPTVAARAVLRGRRHLAGDRADPGPGRGHARPAHRGEGAAAEPVARRSGADRPDRQHLAGRAAAAASTARSGRGWRWGRRCAARTRCGSSIHRRPGRPRRRRRGRSAAASRAGAPGASWSRSGWRRARRRRQLRPAAARAELAADHPDGGDLASPRRRCCGWPPAAPPSPAPSGLRQVTSFADLVGQYHLSPTPVGPKLYGYDGVGPRRLARRPGRRAAAGEAEPGRPGLRPQRRLAGRRDRARPARPGAQPGLPQRDDPVRAARPAAAQRPAARPAGGHPQAGAGRRLRRRAWSGRTTCGGRT